MFKYVGDISLLSHYIIENFVSEKAVAIDGTLGNGHDSDFLRERFKKVYSFEIQEEPALAYENFSYDNVRVINDSHEKLGDYVSEKVNAIIYNLGFLPGGNKEVTTLCESSLNSIKRGLELLDTNGIMTIAIYIGHNEGKKEETCILDYIKTLPKNRFGVLEHRFLNRSKEAPLLIVIEKK